MAKHRVSRRRDGRYVSVLHIGTINGVRKRKYIYGQTAQAVTDQLVALRYDLSKGVPVATSSQTVNEFSKDWLEHSLKLTSKPRGFESFSNTLRLHIIPTLGGIKLNQLAPTHIQKLLKDKLESGLHPLTVNYIRAVLRSMLTKAIRLGLLSRNVATSMYIDSPRARKREVRVLTPEQARTFLTQAQGERYECIYMLALTLGMRRGEIVGLRWSDLDLDSSALRISQTVQRLRTGSDDYLKRTALVPSECKTPKSRRSIVLPEFVTQALRTRRIKQAEQRLRMGAKWKQSDLVFTGKFGRPIEPQSLHTDFKLLLVKAGLSTTLRFHDLRHCAASLLLAKGTHPRLVMELLGHSNISRTMDLYSHVLSESKRLTADTMSEVFASR